MIVILTGTRPEIIKMAPVFKELQARKIPYFFAHSGQHYTKQMDADIIRDLQLRQPDKNLQVGSGSHAIQTGKVMEGIEQVCLDIKPKLMVVHGDTNTTLAGALVAKKLHIPVAHVEAGLRSFDYTMPEEVNRTLVDRISDILFAPSEQAKQNLLNEGIKAAQIVVTGNTIVDAVNQHVSLANNSQSLTKLTKEHPTIKNGYLLVTAHRPENVDDAANLTALFLLLEHAATVTDKPILWPMHPRTAKSIADFSIKIPKSIIVIEPVGYIEMLQLMCQAELILTDSGGIQEEAYLLKKPLMTLRPNTERPETLSANFIIHRSLPKFDQAWKKYQSNSVEWDTTLGTDTASAIIVDTIEKAL